MQWRDMTAEELATRPEARLGGALLYVVIVAALLCVVMLVGLIVAVDQFRAVAGRFQIALAFVAVWAAAFVVTTALRFRITPTLASIGIIAWVVYRFWVSVAGGYGWPLGIDLLAQLAMALAFCGYMAAGVRPNAYYRRRLPAP
jgi:hypothetical protein